MRLKNLELQGYKTFASRTGFVFDSGITAVVGPNGSGKSNIADAIRWVLGEQSYRTLRGKRTEDMIFSGSAQRARLGMASASMTFDNADGWLPIDFNEVTVTRRAYRSGENEYLLNGSRVRLRDITELLAKSGLARRTYTVIGQGLVDAVLSLRADDRRALFEEAAGITLYQAKRADALSRLEETRSNLLRANDIINEIAPRLRRLEREAERAEHHALLTRQLEGLLRTWYGYQWRQEQRNLLRTRDALGRREDRVVRRRQALEDLDRRDATLRTRQAQLREQLGVWHKESSELRRQLEEVQRDLAVWRERARLLARRRDEVHAELAELEVQEQSLGERLAHAQAEVEDAQERLHQHEATAAQAQAKLDTHEEQRATLARRVADGQARLLELATQISDRRNRVAQLDERRASLAQERDEHQSVIAELEAATADLRSRIHDLESEQTRLQSGKAALETEAAQLEETQRQIGAQQAELRDALAAAQRQLEHLQARYESLTRLRQEGEGLHAGVRSLVQARRKLPGIVGSVVQLLHVPAEYEVAVEVALGGHLQDIVVESWADAENAIAFLREGRRGRATLLPLDTVRPVRRLDLPKDPGLIGVAADLVQAEERLAPVVEMLLGRTFVTVDLKAARRTFERFKGGFQIVTLAGEVLRSSGSVTGGQGQSQAQGQVLAREREWRELPAQIEEHQKRDQEIQHSLDAALTSEQEARAQSESLTARLQEVTSALEQVATQRRDLERDVQGLAGQRSWRFDMVSQLDQEAGELDATERSHREQMAGLAAEKDGVEAEAAAAQAELDGLRGDLLYQRLSEARTAEAIARGRWENRQAALDTLRQTESQLQNQIQAKRQQIADLDAEQASLAQQIGSQASRERVIQGWLSSLTQKIDPAEAEVAQLEGEREELELEEGSLRTILREAEGGYSDALLAYNRQEDRLERLRRQIMDDFGLVDMEPTEGLAEQPPLPLGELVSHLPMVEILPEGLEEEMHQIKAQLRRMGAINPNAPDEYGEVLDRYTFLTTQATDLEEAARSLREVIAELDELMRREFLATFELVAARFKENFTKLFGGGTARLVLTDTTDVSLTGVEIVARPPGKRQQTLALLSGGERSLTAVALIFALLEVSPPPFCVLDEVDAMLDEANVKRFRTALQTLSESTQFIVITHNRGTIQAADTIYGVSMGDDSVSQVVSLRLDGNRIAAPDGSSVEVLKEG